MPLRDHFHPPISTYMSWEGFHGLWPGSIVRQLMPALPQGYLAEPRIHLGSFFEIDVSTYATVQPPTAREVGPSAGVATALSTAIEPELEVEADWPEQYEYAVHVFNQSRNRQLVAAIEIVSPGNKDRPESRRAFVAKCAALLHQGVAVVIVDLVTVRHFNLYVELLEWVGRSDPLQAADPSATYAAALRCRAAPPRTVLQIWPRTLAVGQPLPTLPLWLAPDLQVALDLEVGYEETCRVFRIP